MPSSDPQQREAAVLQAMVPNLQADGFEVFMRPDRMMLPASLHGLHPGAIALKPGRKLVIDVVSEGERAIARVARLDEAMAGQAEWELQIVFAPRAPLPPAPPIASEETVRATLARIPSITDAAGPLPALLTAWSAFEAAARLVVPDDASWGRAPAELVDWLTYRGDITNDEADEVRPLARLRDQAAHGGLDRTATRDQLDALVRVTLTMLSEAAKATAA